MTNPALQAVTNDDDVGALMREFVRNFIFQQRQFVAAQGLPSSMRMLALLARQPRMTQSELGKLLSLEKSWVSRSVQQLVDAGWVERHALLADKRCTVLQLTPAGRVQAEQFEQSLNQHASTLLAQIAPTKQKQVSESLSILINALQQVNVASQGETDE